MNDLVKQMQKDAETIPEDNMGKIGAVATDIAEIENEIQKIICSSCRINSSCMYIVMI